MSRHRFLAAFFFLVLLLAAGRNAVVVAREIVAVPRLPQWDMARRGLEGIHLADALRRGDVPELLWRINETSVWPPLFPLLEVPAFLAFGYDYRVPRLLVTCLYFLSVPALFWAGTHLDRRHGAAVGLIAGGFLCASPFYQLFAGLIMLEVPGALLLILCLGAYARALGSAKAGRWRLVWILTTLLFFCKFNYGLMWLVPVLILEAWRLHGGWRGAAEALTARLRAIDLRRPWNLFVAAYAVATTAVLVSGGFATEIAGVRLRLSSIGGPLYHLYLLWALRWCLRPRHHLERFRSWLTSLEPRHRQLVLWVLVPVAVWMLIPPHARDFFDFVRNRSSDMEYLSWESLSFYPRVWMRQYAPTQAWGAVLLALAVLPCLALPRLAWRRRLLVTTLLVGAASMLLHPYKLPRFAFTVAPLVWLSAAMAGTHLLVALLGRLKPDRGRSATLLLAGGLMIVTVAQGVDRQRLRDAFVERTVPRGVERVIDAIHRTQGHGGTSVVLGTWNLLSPSLIEWEIRRGGRDLDPHRLPATVRPGRVRVERICEDLSFDRVIALDPLPGRKRRAVRGYAEEIAPLGPLYAALAEATCFRLEHERAFPRPGYRLRVYRRLTD